MTAVPYPAGDAKRALHQSAALQRLIVRVVKHAFLLMGGIVLAVLFQKGIYLPTRVSVVLIALLAIGGGLACRFAPTSPLTRLMIALYAMPFAVCLGYLLNDYYVWWSTDLAIYYLDDPVTVQIMTMIGVIGLYGLLTGYVFAADAHPGQPPRSFHRPRTLKPTPFVIALVAALFFSFISTPDETIFSASYNAAMGIAGLFNFNASNLVAYTLLMMLVVDAEQERSRRNARMMKRMTVIGVTLFIVIFLQILRGDRDSFGYLVGLAAMFITEPLPDRIAARVRRRRIVVLAASGLIVITVFIALAEVRYRLAVHQDFTFRGAIVSGLTKQSTATAVLLTNLSLAHSYRVGAMEIERGHTYLDYLRSLPPGFITQPLGIERPVERDRGPNFWFTDISAGGVHVVTVPFKNFLAPGAFFVLVLYGWFIARSEVLGQDPRWVNRLWYGTMFVGAAQWFWYGDIVFIRQVMIFVLAAAIYALVRRIGALSMAARDPAVRQSPA